MTVQYRQPSTYQTGDVHARNCQLAYVNKKLCCCREPARCFMSLSISLTHSRSLKVIQIDTLDMCKSLLHCNSVSIWDVQRQIMASNYVRFSLHLRKPVTICVNGKRKLARSNFADRTFYSTAKELCVQNAFYGRPLSVSGRPCYILPMFIYLFIFFMAALFSGPG